MVGIRLRHPSIQLALNRNLYSSDTTSCYQYKYKLKSDFFLFFYFFLQVTYILRHVIRAIGFPTEFFPVLFAIPRMAGYLSHWRESLDDPDTKIMRPAQVIS